MPTFEIKDEDGTIYEVDAPDQEQALKGFAEFQASREPVAPPSTREDFKAKYIDNNPFRDRLSPEQLQSQRQAPMLPAGAQMADDGSSIEFPDTGIQARTDTQSFAQDPEMVFGAAALRNQAAQDGGLTNFTLNSPYGSGLTAGVSYGLADEAISAAGNPMMGEAIQQSYEQNTRESPWASIGSEIAGNVAGLATGGSVLGATKLGGYLGGAIGNTNLGAKAMAFLASKMNTASPATKGAYGALSGVAGTSATMATTARDGERLDAATDPMALAFGGAIGGTLARMFAKQQPVARSASGADTYKADTSVLFEGMAPDEIDNLKKYISGMDDDALNSMSTTYEANKMGVSLPAGMADNNPDMMARKDSVFGGSMIRRGIDNVNDQLTDKISTEIVGRGGKPTSIGQTSDRLEASVRQGLERQKAEIGEKYDANVWNFVNPDEVIPFSPTAKNAVDAMLSRRTMAGIPDGMITNQIKTVIDLTTRPDGATVKAIRDARASIRSQISQLSQKGVDGPDLTSLEEMESALTKAMADGMNALDSLQGNGAGTGKMLAQELLKTDKEYFEINDQIRKFDKYASRIQGAGVVKALKDDIMTGGEKATSNIMAIKNSAEKGYWDNAVAFVIDDLGKNAEGVFDPRTFSNNWSRVADDVKQEVFGSSVKTFDSTARIIKRLEKMQKNSRTTPTDKNIIGAGVVSMLTPTVWDQAMTIVASAWRVYGAKTMAQPQNVKAMANFVDEIESAAKSVSPVRSRISRRAAETKFQSILKGVPSGGVVGFGAGAAASSGQSALMNDEDSGQQ